MILAALHLRTVLEAQDDVGFSDLAPAGLMAKRTNDYLLETALEQSFDFFLNRVNEYRYRGFCHHDIDQLPTELHAIVL